MRDLDNNMHTEILHNLMTFYQSLALGSCSPSSLWPVANKFLVASSSYVGDHEIPGEGKLNEFSK
jgi:hypothetical protein